MTIEQTKDAIRVMQAYVDGKNIESSLIESCDWTLCKIPIWDWYKLKYRIAPDQEEPKEKHYRPYTMEEFVEEMHKHDGFIRNEDMTNCYGITFLHIDHGGVVIGIVNLSYYDMCEDYVWSDDGTPCGKEVEK